MTKIVFDTSYRVQPGDTVKSIAEKGFKDGDRWREVRQENGTHLTSPDSSQLLEGQRVYLPIKIGERLHPSGYGEGDDFLSTDDLTPLSPIYSKFYQGLIRFSPANLLLNRQIINPIIDYFFQGKGGVYQHGIDAPLSRLVEDSPPFKLAFNQVIAQIQQQLQSLGNVDSIEVQKLKISIPHFAFKPGKADLTLFATIGGIQGAELLLKRFTLNTDYSYSLEVFFVIYDDFGFGKDDRYTPSLYAAWNLQHRGEAKPFVNEIILHKTLTGNLSFSKKLDWSF
ncbi:MAG: LysM domain-containing protein [Lyngbya sp.]|nr:LysM domain-containing protein [Lyngbya sp.]